MCVASLLGQGTREGNQGLDLVLRKLFAERSHLGLGDAVHQGFDDLVVGGGLLPLGAGEVGHLVLAALLGLAAAVGAVAERAVLLERLLRRGARLDRRGRRDGSLGEQGESERDHGASCARASSPSNVWRNATSSWISDGCRRFPKSGILFCSGEYPRAPGSPTIPESHSREP